MNIINKISKYHGFSILCGLGILVLCTVKIPQQEEISKFQHIDKVTHFLMYFIFSATVILESVRIKSSPKNKYLRICVSAILISAIFGGIIEIIQGTLTNYRSADIMDWLFDLGGAITAYLIVELIRRAFR